MQQCAGKGVLLHSDAPSNLAVRKSPWLPQILAIDFTVSVGVSQRITDFAYRNSRANPVRLPLHTDCAAVRLSAFGATVAVAASLMGRIA